MRIFLNIIKGIRHPEERLEGASRRTYNASAADIFAFSQFLHVPVTGRAA
jgi:hypothetical protein